MGNVGKSLCLLLVAMLGAVSLLAVQPSAAQSIPKPSVPEFTMRYVDRSYDAPPTTITTTDPYTGKTTTETIYQGYHVENETIEFILKNQVYIKNENTTGYWASGLFYQFRFKGHYEDESHWKTEPPPSGHFYGYFQASNGAETVISLSLQKMASDHYLQSLPKIGAQIDFQVQAHVGHEEERAVTIVFVGESSGWSPTQTITIPPSDSSPAPSPTVPELPWFTLLPVCLLVLFAALVLKRKSLSKPCHRW